MLALDSGDAVRLPAYIYTATPQFDPNAWTCGQERFPRGAAIRLFDAGAARDLAPDFYASADPEVSFDGQRVLFAAKPHREDPWQIWEVAVGAHPQRVAAWPEDAIRPLYLPGNKIVYARKTAQGYRLEVLALSGGEPLRITYAPGNYLTCDVLHDGRVLYEAANDLYTVYPDGSGVEAYRCDHGPSRHAARQLGSRDVVFTTANGFARFTSALATQVDLDAVHGDFAGPFAELTPEEWIVSFRRESPFPLCSPVSESGDGALAKISHSARRPTHAAGAA